MNFSIYNYRDYQKALNDFYIEAKEHNRAMSHRYIAQKMGFSSGFFSQVISGKSNISDKNILKFAKLLKLNECEAEYFETLVLYNQAKIPETKRLHFDKLISLNTQQAVSVGDKDYLFYDKWYYSAILELIDFFPFDGENYTELAQQLSPKISEYEAQQAIAMLHELELIEMSDNHYTKTNRLITTRNSNHSKALAEYARLMIDLGKETIESADKKDRNISWLTMSIDEESVDSVIEEIRQMRRRIMEIASAVPEASRVFQLNVQLFPLSEEFKNSEDE